MTTTPQPTFNLREPEPDPSNPWGYDALNRKHVANSLTNLISGQRKQAAPLVLSLHGGWGTGKTFLLQRWRAALQNDNFHAIYFNAWEDDFCVDPLVAIIGQLATSFESAKNAQASLKKAGAAFVRSLPKIAISQLQNATGIPLQPIVAGAEAARAAAVESSLATAVAAYQKQTGSRDILKSALTKLSESVYEATDGKPLVFIIDELDRCRPTFAIELLERVKHIFSVPNTVFVFGINRDELCKSIQSVYGDIDADTYLHRFFDMRFTLPVPDTHSFCRHVMNRYGFQRAFSESLSADDQMETFHRDLPSLCDAMGLSLRDVQHCVRAAIIIGRNRGASEEAYPFVTIPLIFLRLKNPDLYYAYLQSKCRAKEIINWFSGQIDNEELLQALNDFECCLYLTDAKRRGGLRAANQILNGIRNGEVLSSVIDPGLLSVRAQAEPANSALRSTMHDINTELVFRKFTVIERAYGLIDLTDVRS